MTHTFLRPIAIVSTAIPPSPSGQARVLAHLLEGGAGAGAILLSDNPPALRFFGNEYGHVRRLSAARFATPAGFSGPPTTATNPSLIFDACRRAAEIANVVRANDLSVLLACSGTPFDLQATALAALQLGKPFVAYLFNDPVYQWPHGELRDFASWQEGIWSRHVAAAITPNAAMSDVFASRTGIRSRVIPNAVDTALYEEVRSDRGRRPSPMRIVYTGSVHHAQADAFRNLVHAIEKDRSFELHIYSSQPKSALETNGVTGRGVFYHRHVRYDAVHKVQARADVLFLPLAFESATKEMLRTVAPAKLGEYLAAARPILVHAPEDTFLCRYFRAHRAGLVVGQPNANALRAALASIRDDPSLVRRLVSNSKRLSGDYEAKHVRASFWSLMEEVAQTKTS